MFIGREKELAILERLYQSNKFEFLVMYGRRRVGKTEILKKFSKSHNTIFFQALEKKNNLDDFASCVKLYYNEKFNINFNEWIDIFKYILSKSYNEKIVIIIDEFPYIVKDNPSIKSIFQYIIDHLLMDKNILLVLCGSSVSFMINDVMGSKAPLYGRSTAVLEVLPFDYTIVRKFLPNYSKEDQIKTYNILGGVPYYLSQFKDNLTIEENIAMAIVSSSASLREEPITLLKSELREPSTYNTILEALSKGSNRITEIAEKTKIDVTKLPKYLKTLQEMRIIEKIVCCGEKNNSKKSQYVIKDNFFSFWYSFIFTNQTKIELMAPLNFVKSFSNDLAIYMGYKFEKVCLEYIKNQAKTSELPFIPSSLGKWWGTNKITKSEDNIDILGIDKDNYLFCECKFKNELFDIKEFNDLINISNLFTKANNKYYYFFVKSSYKDNVKELAKNYNCKLIDINMM